MSFLLRCLNGQHLTQPHPFCRFLDFFSNQFIDITVQGAFRYFDFNAVLIFKFFDKITELRLQIPNANCQFSFFLASSSISLQDLPLKSVEAEAKLLTAKAAAVRPMDKSLRIFLHKMLLVKIMLFLWIERDNSLSTIFR